MLVFVIPLQSPEASRDWERISRLAVRTVRSACNQTSPDYQVILVCNQRPEGCPTHEKLTVIEEEFPLPEPSSAGRMRDKFRKVHRGLIEARRFAPAHIMITDADDCVSRRLAAFVASYATQPGWYLGRGYVHDEGTRWLFGRKNFDVICGTSAIVRVERSDLPQSMEDDPSQFTLLAFGHGVIREGMAQRGDPLQSLPFPGAVYITGTGENDSGTYFNKVPSRRFQLQKYLDARYLTPWVRREFGL